MNARFSYRLRPLLPQRAGPTWARAAGLTLLLVSVAGCVAPPMREHRQTSSHEARGASAPMYFYPQQQQSEARQDRDRYDCYRWAVQQSGVDPGMTPIRQAPRSRDSDYDGREVAGGAAAGAVLGAATASPRHAGDSMVLGALFGAALGAMAQESRVQAAERRDDERQQQAQQPLNNFRRAMGACMEGRGYRIG